MADARPRSSVRVRITAIAGVVVLVVLVVSSVVLVVAARRLRLDDVDAGLRRRADDVASLVADDPAPTLVAGDEEVIQLVDGGVVVAASAPAIAGVPVAEPVDGERIVSVERLPVDDDRFRLLSRRLDDGRLLHLARGIDDLNAAEAALITTLLVFVPSVTALLMVLVWVLVGRTLRPVETIRSEVAAIGADRLHRRVPAPAGDDEIARLARTMNEMLDRVEAAHTRQREFTADASHELRSPLARIRAELEVDLAHPDDADPWATHASVLEEVEVLQHMIDDLLLLARDGESGPVPTTPVDLDDLVLAELAALGSAHNAAGGAVTVDHGRVSGAQVRGDAGQLARLVRNLLDNAVRHAESRVEVSLGEWGDDARLVIADDGPGIPPGDRERVFERFTRLDQARARAGGGTGLGLTIARGVATRHGGTLTADEAPGGGAAFVLVLPRSR